MIYACGRALNDNYVFYVQDDCSGNRVSIMNGRKIDAFGWWSEKERLPIETGRGVVRLDDHAIVFDGTSNVSIVSLDEWDRWASLSAVKETPLSPVDMEFEVVRPLHGICAVDVDPVLWKLRWG